VSRRDLPVKLYYRIGEVAQAVGVQPHVLRYWESEFGSIRPQKSARGQRVYSHKDLEKLLRVKELLHTDGYTIAGAKKKMRHGGLEPDPEGDTAQEALGKLRSNLLEIRAEIEAELAGLGDED
jgi:DNA-binding transcriptional MerR regulator